jgi:hypothetical protein
VGTEGNCDIVQSDECFCQGDENNDCNGDINSCYNGLKCEIVSTGGTKVCQTSSSVSCAEANASPTPSPLPPTTSITKKSKSLSPPALIGIVIASSVVALVGGSYFIRRWYVRSTLQEEAGEDSFIDE